MSAFGQERTVGLTHRPDAKQLLVKDNHREKGSHIHLAPKYGDSGFRLVFDITQLIPRLQQHFELLPIPTCIGVAVGKSLKLFDCCQIAKHPPKAFELLTRLSLCDLVGEYISGRSAARSQADKCAQQWHNDA